MQDSDIQVHFEPLFDDLDPADEFYNAKPLLAHYTSLEIAYQILKHEEIWLSNPVLMNDHEEVRFGIDAGLHAVLINSTLAAALQTPERANTFRKAFEILRAEFVRTEVPDTYVFSWSKHEPEDSDGILSMWRGYGANGGGVALVMDTSQISVNPKSPFSLARVHYGTNAARRAWLDRLVDKFSGLLATAELTDQQLIAAAWCLFQRIKAFALFSKHIGFREEAEWRLVYWKVRDPDNLLGKMVSYHLSPSGIVPKLKLKIGPIPGVTIADDFSVSKITRRIILGPTVSSHLAVTAMKRMLADISKPQLCDRVVASSIPYRAR